MAAPVPLHADFNPAGLDWPGLQGVAERLADLQNDALEQLTGATQCRIDSHTLELAN